MSGEDSLIGRLSELVGIPSRYTDAHGQPVEIEPERRRGILGHLGFPAGTDREAQDSLARIEAFRNAIVPKLVTLAPRRPADIRLRPNAGERVSWRLTDEAGHVREGRSAQGRMLHLPVLPEGYYELDVEAGGERARSTLIVAPERCWQPGWMRRGGRAWGLAAQVYSFRSGSNLGIGSYADIGEAASGAGPLGASFLGLSPVHALFSADRTKISPYSPSSRLFLETIHIDPKAVPGFAGSRAAGMLEEEGRAARIAALRDAALVDHAGIWTELSPVLEALWQERGRADEDGFAAFRREHGEKLLSHATFEALHEHFRAEGRWWLGDWPEEYRRNGSEAVRRFAAEKHDRVEYHAWLQYLADRQLAAASQAAKRAGMSLGLYRDLAVGSDRGGSEIWSHPERFGNTLSIGAPPDLLAPQGQDWGLPPLDPLVLEEQGLAAFRDLVQANMRHAGAIRIDHAFQLERLYLIPVGESGAAGAYVSYPFEAMLAVLRLESHRQKSLVIAEDLGTGPEGFSDAIMRSGILSYRVLSFERSGDGGFKPPAEYPADALTVVTTHDLPTFVGWWRGLDTDLRQSLGIYDPERAEKERRERVVEREKLAQALHAERLLPSPEPPDEPPTEAVMRYLARTPSALNAIQYEDVLGSRSQPNMPGTTEGHPNWRRKLDLDIATIGAPGGPLAKIAAAVSAEGRGTRATTSPLSSPPPRATYRFQFHKDFTFDHAIEALPYLKKLGISHVYSSPIAKARPGSTHGYDIVDPSAINPELGGEEGFRRLSDALKEHGLCLILDVVPNHLGVGGADNPWWLSTLEWGQLSPHARAFDIDWERLGANGKLIIPVLGERYGDALENGDLRLAFDEAEGSFSVWHHEHRLPITPLSYPLVLDRALAVLDELEGHAEVIAVSDRLRTMVEETSPERRAAFPEEAELLKRRLAAAVTSSDALRAALERAIAVVNGVPGLPESFGTLHRILEMQAYRPAHWRVAASDINYRRFFDINGLGGIRVELPEIFEAAHALVFRLVREGRVHGLRIDHIDGLADPEGYVQKLQSALGPGFYIVVEKILEPGEPLRPWPIAGTTGYDVLNLIDGIFVDTAAAGEFERIYRDFTGLEGSYEEQLRAAKIEILVSSFASELEVLVSDLKRIADGDRRTRDYTVYAIRVALIEIIARFPVYRSYITEEPSPEDVELIESTVAAAKRRSALPDRSVHDFAASALLGRVETEGPGRPAPDHVARFRRRFQQLTGPVMAKSLEDTLFYRYARLISLNEVGGDPGHFGVPLAAFHKANEERARSWPNAMIATATHDTKRGEDARARLNALSEMPEAWREALAAWQEVAAPHLGRVEGAVAPDPNDHYMLLQALLGALPLEILQADGADELERFRTRFHGYVEKALREAKRHSSWVDPNEAYESAARRLVDACLAPGSAFLSRFRPLAARLARAGAVNGLARTVLKCTLPGVPDTYQGCGFWDFSLVDPDNRRPVDYASRARALDAEAPPAELARSWQDGRVKQHVLARLLNDRAARPDLYADGSYEPLGTSDTGARIVAFRRRSGTEELIAVVPRGASRLPDGDGLPLGEAWGDLTAPVPVGRWRSILDDREIHAGQDGVAARELFAALPVSVLRRAE
ncbi:malto-oligosyltrehalose synthase [Enterovirga aerilata]|uniref:4-alpha-glucanotransferase n=1 Tax=Enterovirga aerilata TaxID=2730920 RepID=A0A849IKL1_9HYPH|nr:malto-oligosyltrehalose synthase [Enterovirga sp. DB1703]NNM74483.1 malto-oligosyltrehalose synthase [Enterovirga sp. DB1703]